MSKTQLKLEIDISCQILVQENWDKKDGELLLKLKEIGGNEKFNTYMDKYFANEANLSRDYEKQN